jgi:hypothetical protein
MNELRIIDNKGQRDTIDNPAPPSTVVQSQSNLARQTIKNTGGELTVHRHVGLNDLLKLISGLAFGSIPAMADKFAITIDEDAGPTTPPLDFTFNEPIPMDLVNEALLTLFAGLANITLLDPPPPPLLPSPFAGESCGIILDRLLPFSFRIGPIFDRLLPLPLLPIPTPDPDAIPPSRDVEGPRLAGLPCIPWRSRFLGICKLLPESPESSGVGKLVKLLLRLLSDNG